MSSGRLWNSNTHRPYACYVGPLHRILGAPVTDKPRVLAAGTRVHTPRSEFRVRILYREPTYQSHQEGREGRKRPYRWTYVVEAQCSEDAKAQAMDEFRQVERLSSVGWSREITDIEIVD